MTTAIGLPTHDPGRECSRCKEWKDSDQFYRNARYKSGLSSYCKFCMSGYSSVWLISDIGVNSRKRAQFRAHLKRKYGLSVEDYDRMYLDQNGVCAICLTNPGRRALCVDHCHTTGTIRGLLCDNCNHGVGKFADSTVLLTRAAEYLERSR